MCDSHEIEAFLDILGAVAAAPEDDTASIDSIDVQGFDLLPTDATDLWDTSSAFPPLPPPVPLVPMALEVPVEPALSQPPRPAAKGCTCRNTKCLKKYCMCYARGDACGDDCACINCENTVSRSVSPKSFDGCNCKRGCDRNYCECFKANRACGQHCNCRGCKNCDTTEEDRKRMRLVFTVTRTKKTKRVRSPTNASVLLATVSPGLKKAKMGKFAML